MIDQEKWGYAQKQSTGYAEEMPSKEPPVLQTLLQIFEKANQEQSLNCDRLMVLSANLNNEPPSSNKPIDPLSGSIRKGLTSGEGLLSAMEGMIKKYQETINLQHAVLLRMEKLI